ncbi:hypothetical protein EDD22DRAFT_918385 [Suillus occidentalis]|nr:hypothetical protein EDD22DRAFT_918385 [Suillus occidentalis]
MTWTSAGDFAATGGPDDLGSLGFYHTERNASGGNVHSFDSIDWEDLSLYTMPLSVEELQAINADTTFPQLRDPSMANLSSTSDTSGYVPPSRIPSPIENTRPDPLRDANSSTWAARNPTRSVIRARTPPPRLSDAQKASRKVKRDQKMETTKRLHDAVQLTNALIHAKAKEMNTDQPVGSRYTLVELREMVANDPQMKGLTKDEKAGYIAALSEHREQNVTNVRGNNMAAARDVLLTTERVVKELDDLRVRTGTYANICRPSMHGTDNSEDFWEDVYDIPMADYLRQYEQWACTQNQNLNERDSLEAVRKQVRKMIVRGLIAVTGKKNITMNYSNYETAVVETYAVQLIGWPASIKFINPSNIGTVGDIRKLRDALKARTCYWAALTRNATQERSDAGGSRKRKAYSHNRENKRPSKKARKMAASSSEAPKEEDDFEAK